MSSPLQLPLSFEWCNIIRFVLISRQTKDVREDNKSHLKDKFLYCLVLLNIKNLLKYCLIPAQLVGKWQKSKLFSIYPTSVLSGILI